MRPDDSPRSSAPVLPVLLFALLPLACGGESQAAEEGSAAAAWREAREAALETLGHAREGLSRNLDDARRYWEENRDEWRRELDAELERMGEAIERLRSEGRARAAEAAEELKRARTELAELLERGKDRAAEEWADQAEALRQRIDALERRVHEMTAPEEEAK